MQFDQTGLGHDSGYWRGLVVGHTQLKPLTHVLQNMLVEESNKLNIYHYFWRRFPVVLEPAPLRVVVRSSHGPYLRQAIQ